MSSHFCKRRRSWRNLKKYRQGSPRFRKILLLLIGIEFLIFIWVTLSPVRFFSQVYSGWEYEFEGESSIYGVKIRWKDGEIDFYKTEKILQ